RRGARSARRLSRRAARRRRAPRHAPGAGALRAGRPVQRRRPMSHADPPPDLTAAIESAAGIHVLRDHSITRGWNNIRYRTGLSARNTPTRRLSMNVATVPPGGVAYAHIHVDF